MERYVLIIVWASLAAATALSLFTSEYGTLAAEGSVAIILGLALLKVQIVLTKFVEIGSGSWPWRCFFEGWLLVVTAEIAYFYWA
jgi:hypothetical protein